MNGKSCLNVKQVALRYGVSTQTIWYWMRRGRFPQPLRVTPKCSRWTLEMLDEFDNNRDYWQPKIQRRRSQKCMMIEDEEVEYAIWAFCPIEANTSVPLSYKEGECRMCQTPLGDRTEGWVELTVEFDVNEVSEMDEVSEGAFPDWTNFTGFEEWFDDVVYGHSCYIQHRPFWALCCSRFCALALEAKRGDEGDIAREKGVQMRMPSYKTLEKYPKEWRQPLVASRFLDFKARLVQVERNGGGCEQA